MIPAGAIWSVCGIGRAQLPLGMAAMPWADTSAPGSKTTSITTRASSAESNAQLVARLSRIAGEIGRPVATSAQAREILGLPAL